ncbi:MAG: Lrp/AsnC family transcriptional regulator [Pseudomonadota bacterium]
MIEERTDAIDETGWRMIDALQRDGRMAFSELGRRLSLSPPAVADRVKKLHDIGVFRKFKAVVDHAKLGAPVMAFVSLRAEAHFHPRIEAMAGERADILECHHVAGDDSFILKARVRDLAHLERLLSRFNQFAHTKTSIVLSTKVEDKLVGPPPRA